MGDVVSLRRAAVETELRAYTQAAKDLADAKRRMRLHKRCLDELGVDIYGRAASTGIYVADQKEPENG